MDRRFSLAMTSIRMVKKDNLFDQISPWIAPNLRSSLSPTMGARAQFSSRLVMVISISAGLFIAIPNAGEANTPICAPGQQSTPSAPCTPPPPPLGQGPGPSSQYSLAADPEVIDEARTHLRVNEPASGTHAMVYWDQNQISFRSVISLESGVGADKKMIRCTSIEDPLCDRNQAGVDTIYYNSVVGNCASTPDSMCVKDFQLVDGNGATIATGIPTRRIHSKSLGWKSTFDAKSNTGFPGSDEPWIWTLDGVEYLHLGLLESLYRKEGDIWRPNADKNLRFSFYPIKKKYGVQFKDDSMEMGCIATEEGICYQRVRFKEGLRFKLTIRVPSNITGWLNGRLDKPIAYTTPYDDNYTDLTVEAAPLQEIISAQWMPYTEDVQDYLRRVSRLDNLTAGAKNYDIPPIDPDNTQALPSYLELEKKNLIKDVATTVELSWRLQTTTSDAQRFVSNCTTGNQIDGIVTSNAAVYEPGSPKFDSDEGALIYKVAAPHYKPDGKTENLGRYAFAMREELIKCVYGLDKLPPYAQVEVSYGSDGENRVSSVALGTRNKWVHLAADNFTYSAPTLKVKLEGWKKSSATSNTQPNQPNPNQPQQMENVIVCQKGSERVEVRGSKPECSLGFVMVMVNGQQATPPKPEVMTEPAAKTKVTITCVKGKATKKVTGTNPKCPKGFKKK